MYCKIFQLLASDLLNVRRLITDNFRIDYANKISDVVLFKKLASAGTDDPSTGIKKYRIVKKSNQI